MELEFDAIIQSWIGKPADLPIWPVWAGAPPRGYRSEADVRFGHSCVICMAEGQRAARIAETEVFAEVEL